MAEKKLSEELRNCLDGNGCQQCSNYQSESRLTCPKLFEKAYEVVKRYEEMEEQGKLLKLPCAVGDTVYQHMIVGIDKDKKKPIYKIFEAIVFKFSLSSWGLCFWTETTDKEKHRNEVPLSAFNNTVFLTRPEAERALAEMEEKK